MSVREITNRLPDFEFHMITARLKRKLPKTELMGSIFIHRIGIGIPLIDKLLLPSLGALKALRLNHKHKFQAYWCIMVSFASLAAYKANFLYRKKVPLIVSLQEGDSEEYFAKKWGGLIDFSWKLILKKTSFLTTLSTHLQERARKLGYVGKTQIVPNGVDVRKFSQELLPGRRAQLRQEFALVVGDVVLITASRLTAKNGIADVIKALPLLPPNIKFIIFGTGELKQDLKELASILGVSNRVSFKGFVSHSELPQFFKASDIFIRTSLSEGFGNSFVEAMAAGLPCIATPVGGIVDFIKENETGIFAKVGNPQSIADAVMKLVDNPDLVSKIKKQAFEMVKSKYDWDIIAQEMKKIFKAL